MMMATVGAGCASGPSKEEQTICTVIQRMMDGLSEGDNAKALTSLGPLEVEVRKTDNKKLRAEGQRFFDVIGATVDPSALTPQQTAEKGTAALGESAGALQGMLDECKEVGAEVKRVPGPRPPTG